MLLDLQQQAFPVIKQSRRSQGQPSEAVRDYGGVHIGVSLIKDMFLRRCPSQRRYTQAHMLSLRGRVLKMDKTFGMMKRVKQADGSPASTGTVSIMNEYGEIVAWQNIRGNEVNFMEEVKPALVALQGRYERALELVGAWFLNIVQVCTLLLRQQGRRQQPAASSQQCSSAALATGSKAAWQQAARQQPAWATGNRAAWAAGHHALHHALHHAQSQSQCHAQHLALCHAQCHASATPNALHFAASSTPSALCTACLVGARGGVLRRRRALREGPGGSLPEFGARSGPQGTG